MIEAGEDPRYIARRLMIHASEDVGMADPTALPVAVAAAQVVQLVGMPEARLALTQATIHLATAPKSNAVIGAIDAAMGDVRAGKAGAVSRRTCGTGTIPGRHGSGTRRATSIRTIGRGRSPRSSIRRTNWSGATTITRPGTVRNGALAERVPKLRRPCGVRPRLRLVRWTARRMRQRIRRTREDHERGQDARDHGAPDGRTGGARVRRDRRAGAGFRRGRHRDRRRGRELRRHLRAPGASTGRELPYVPGSRGRRPRGRARCGRGGPVDR